MVTMPDRTGMLDTPYTVKEAAELLRVTESTVRDWLRDKKIRGHRVGGTQQRTYRWRIPRSEVDRLIS